MKIYDDMSSSSISSQLKSTYSRMKSAVNKQREGANVEPVNEHNHVAAIRLPLRDAHWSREAQDTMTMKRRDLRGPGQEALRGGKWYKIVHRTRMTNRAILRGVLIRAYQPNGAR